MWPLPLHRLISMTFTKSKVLIIGRRYSRKFTKVCHIKKLRDPFFIHGGALHTRTCCFRFLSFCPHTHSHSLHHFRVYVA
jgi:hypothetical protein